MLHRMIGMTAGLLLLAAPASAQVAGLPVYNPGVPTGIGLYADVGFPNQNAGGGRAFAATARAGFGVFGVTATLGVYDPSGIVSSQTVYGATGNLRLFGGGLVPLSVTLQGGYGRRNLPTVPATDGKEERIPIGVGFAVNVPTPAVTFKPWLAPRLDVVRTTVGSTSSDTEANFALSGGIEVNSITGLGLHVAYDYLRVDGGNAGVFGVGFHAGLKIPGL